MAKNSDSREKIIQAASHLFAQRGYSAIGVREIVKEANVNISMISYYFNGKAGILIEIINKFFDLYADAIENSFLKPLPLEEQIHVLVKNLVTVIRENHDIFKVAFLELPYDVPEIAEIRGNKINMIRFLLGEKIFNDLKVDEETEKYMLIIGPAIITMIFSNFIMGPSLQSAFVTKFNDTFYNDYTRVITSLIINGLPGTISQLKE